MKNVLPLPVAAIGAAAFNVWHVRNGTAHLAHPMYTSAMLQTSVSKLSTTQTKYLPVKHFLPSLTMYGYNNMDYQTLQTVIEDLTAIKSIEGAHRLIEKYEAMAEAVEADMAREFGQDIDWENEEVKDLFEMDDGS